MSASPLRRGRLPFLHRLLPLLLALLALGAAGIARADPPMRATRLSFVDGTVSLSPAGDGQWHAAPLNRPLAVGDRLWTEQESSAEVQLGAATARVGPRSDVTVLDFDDRIAQFRLTQGTLRLRVHRLDPGQAYEIATPNLAFTVVAPGEYRVDVDAADDSTLVMVRRGQARVDGEGNAYSIHEGRAYRFWGTRLRDQEEVALPALDGLEQWARERDQRAERAAAATWVSTDVIGYQDLDAWGVWRTDPVYGAVWTPSSVVTGWAPYVYGRWAWVAPWGWTWIDDAPWGFAVTHYGRWAHLGGRWSWVPGPARVRAVYSPALVVFVGGPGFRLSASFGGARGVAWYPLGPREVYQPPYRVTRNYFTTINVSNTIVETRVVHDVYDGRSRTPQAHVNRNVPGAVVAMPERGFARGEPVRQSVVRVPREELGRGQVTPAPEVLPARPEPRPDRDAGSAPPPVRERPVITRNAPQAPADRFDRGPGDPRPGTSPSTRPERMDRIERPDRMDRPEPSDRTERPGRIERPEGVERAVPPVAPPVREYRTDPGARPEPGVRGEPPMRNEPRIRTEPPVRDEPTFRTAPPSRSEPPRVVPQDRADDDDVRGRPGPFPASPPREERTAPRFDPPQFQPRLESERPRAPAMPVQPMMPVQPLPARPAEPAAPMTPAMPPPARVPLGPPAGVERFAPREPATSPERFAPRAPSMSPERFAPREPAMPPERFSPREQAMPPQRLAPQPAPQAAPRRFEPPQAPQAPRQGFERRDRGMQQQ
jgi:hypothetical protein